MHRVYSLMVLLRLDDEYKLLTPAVRDDVYKHVEGVRDAIVASQNEDGRWRSDWPDGESARRNPIDEPLYRQVIATGHNLEWLAIAYPELQPDREVVRRAAAWAIQTTRDTPQEALLSQYTFFSHVGNALALWRKTHPADAYPKLRSGQPLTP